jgi:ribosomal protein L23
MVLENIIIAPVVTEKSVGLNKHGVYVFFVDKNATKVDIKNAFAFLFGRGVKSIRLSKMPKKERVAGRSGPVIKRRVKRKAYVRFFDVTPFEFQMVKFKG